MRTSGCSKVTPVPEAAMVMSLCIGGYDRLAPVRTPPCRFGTTDPLRSAVRRSGTRTYSPTVSGRPRLTVRVSAAEAPSTMTRDLLSRSAPPPERVTVVGSSSVTVTVNACGSRPL